MKTQSRTRWLKYLFLVIAFVALAVPRASAWEIGNVTAFTGYNIAKDSNLNNLNWNTENACSFTGIAGASNGRSYTFYSCVTGDVYISIYDEWKQWIGSNGTSISVGGDGVNFSTASKTSHEGSYQIKVTGCQQGGKYKADVYCKGDYFNVAVSLLEAPAVNPKYYITGDFNGWSNAEFNNSGTTYSYTFTTNSNNVNFVIKKDNTYYGPSSKQLTTVNLNQDYDLDTNPGSGNNFVIAAPGEYTVTLTLSGDTPSKIRVTGTPVSTVETLEISSDNGTTWSTITNNSTVKPFDNLTSSNMFLVKSTWSDGEIVYFTFSENPTSNGDKTLIVTSTGNGSALGANVKSASMKVNVTSKTAATITISDITFWPNFYLCGSSIGWDAKQTYKFVYDASSDSYNLTLPNGLANQEFKIYCSTDDKWYGKNMNGSFNTNVEVGTEQTLYSNQSANVYAYNWGTSKPVYVNIKLSGTTGLNIMVTRDDDWYIIGNQFGNSYNTSCTTHKMTPEVVNGTRTGKYYYEVGGGMGNYDTDYFRFHDGENQYGPNGSDNININTYNSKQSITVTTSHNFRWKGAYEKCVIWLDGNTKQIWLENKIALKFKTIEERKFSSRNEDAVFLEGNYLTNGKLAADWEMTTTDNQTYTLRNVVLRGTTTVGKRDLHFVVVDKTGKMTTYHYTPDASLFEFDDNTKVRQYGRAFNITFKKPESGSTTPTITVTKVSDAIPFLGLVGYRYQQKTNGATPNNRPNENNVRGTARGWQESWVLYDDNRTPMRDKDGQYMYSLQWPPKNPVQFSGVREGKDPVEMSSENLTFLPYKENNAVLVKTGADWKNFAPFQVEAYNGLTGKSLAAAPGMQRAAASSNGSLQADVKYMRYTINNVWVLGSTKIWTGWGGQLSGDNAEWNGHMNFGFSNQKGSDVAGTDISSKTAYKMEEDAGNFMFEKPTYFKTVELFMPVNESTLAPLAFDNNTYPVFYTTLGKGEPSILAASTKLVGSERVNNTGKVTPSYNETYFNNDEANRPTSYRIIRYKGNTSTSSADFSKWQPAVTENCPGGVVFSWTTDDATISGVPTLTEIASNYSKDADIRTSWKDVDELENGLYFYSLELYNAAGNLVERVASNTFSIANVDMTPSIRALQLLELTEDGVNAIDSNGEYGLKFVPESEGSKFGAKGQRLYVTYQPDSDINDDYYVINENGNIVIPVADEDALAAIEAHKVLWTTRYFVRAGNVKIFEAAMQEALDNGIIKNKPEPTYTVSYYGYHPTTGVNELRTMENDEMGVSESGTIGFITKYTEGYLENFEFTSKLEYTYKDKDNNTIAYTEDDARTDNLTVKPYVPGAYNLRYTYSQHRDETSGTIPEGTKLKTTSSVVRDNGTIYLQGGLKSGGMVKDLELGQMAHRHLDCEFYFDRPNVSAAILDNYEIYYDLLFTNNDDQKNVLKDKIVYDDKNEDNEKGVKSYKVTAEQVHPNTTTFPILAIKGTVYVKNGTLTGTKEEKVAAVEQIRCGIENGTHADYQMYHTPKYAVKTVKLSDAASAPTYTGKMLIEYGVNTSEYIPMTIGTESAKFYKAIDVWNDGVTKRAHFQLEGITFSHKRQDGDGKPIGDELYGDVIHTAGGEDIALNAVYYDVETFTGNPTGIKYNENTGRLEQDKVYVEYYDAPLFTVDEYGNFTNGEGNYIAVGFADNVAPTDLKIEITPIYIFRRDPSPAANQYAYDDDDKDLHILGLKVLGNNSSTQASPESSGPQGAPMMRAASDAPTPSERIPGVLTMVNEGTVENPKMIEYYTLRGEGSQVEVSSSIGVVTAVHGINAEAFDVDAEYYNLQGLRVSNPEKGQVYIVKRGAKATREFLY